MPPTNKNKVSISLNKVQHFELFMNFSFLSLKLKITTRSFHPIACALIFKLTKRVEEESNKVGLW